MNDTWTALAREAGIAAEHIAIGATALGKANYAQHAYYGQVFFAFTIGFERATKLALVVDHAIDHDGAFPSHTTLRNYGHDLRRLLDQAAKIATRRHLSGTHFALPNTKIHDGIVGTLTDFATNLTRYYNLDLVTGDPGVVSHNDPVRAWFELVTIPVLAAHYRLRQRDRHEQNAKRVAQMLEGLATVHYRSETGDTIDSVYEASRHTGVTEFARPYERMYVLQIARFLGIVLSKLGGTCNTLPPSIVPNLSEFFEIFRSSDRDFRQRKGWSIYRR